MSLEEGSHWEGKYEEKTFNIVTPHIFSESSMSRSSKGQGDTRGTPTMFIEIIEVKGRGGVFGGSAGRGYPCSGVLGRVEVDFIRPLLLQVVTTSPSVSGRVTFVGLQWGKMGQKDPPRGRSLR